MHISNQLSQTSQIASLHNIPSGASGTHTTLKMMRQLVRHYKKALPIRQKALSLVSDFISKDWLSEIKALHAFVRDEIRYIKDVNGVETLYTPIQMMKVKQGDCDDKSTLLASLLESIGHPTRFVALGNIPGKFSHVMVETKLGKNWVSLETTENVQVGWFPKKMKSRMVVYN